jgi:poly[(R)-3-hydroxyalkanoate] polymerase subunit PhaC
VTAATPSGVLSRIEREVRRVQVRARNGLRHLGGTASGAIAVTPRSVVWQRDNVALYRYDSDVRTRTTPILLVMSLVTKPYVFDLRPGSSLVEDLLAAGHDVFLLDWGVPEPVDAHNGIDTYTDQYLVRAFNETKRVSGADQVTILGYCLGGLLTLLFVAGHPAMPVRSLVLLATPVALNNLGPMTKMLGNGRLDPDDVVDETGNVPASVVIEGFRLVQPTAPLATYANLWASLAHDEALEAHNALIGWSNDHIPFPGKAFRQLVEGYIRGGAPLSGTAPVGDRTVDLREIRCPVLSVVGERDNLVPPAASAPLPTLLRDAALDTVSLPAGHAGLFVGRQARLRCVPAIIDWLEANN